MAGTKATEGYNEAGNTDSGRKTVDLCGWLTPSANDDAAGNPGAKMQAMLGSQVKLACWPTPQTEDTGESASARKGGENLAVVAASALALAAWPTPNTMEGGQTSRGGKRKGEALMDELVGWATPRAEDAESAGMRHGRGVADTLTAQAGQGLPLAGWGTPRVTTNGGNGNPERGADGQARLEDQVHGIVATSSPAATARRGVLRPGHSRWLMGYPAAWDSCGATAMQSCRKSRRSS